MLWCWHCPDNGVGEWLILNDACVGEPRISNHFMAKFHTRYCGLVCVLHVRNKWCLPPAKLLWVTPAIADPCIKRTCTLNRPRGTLQPSRAPLIVNVGSVAVSHRAPYNTTMPRHLKVEIFHHFEPCIT